MNVLSYIAVDDEPNFLKDLDSKLEPYSYLNQLALFKDVFEAVSFINAKQPDVIFLDYEMPVLTGRDILEKINYKAQVVFITSHFKPIQEIVNHSGSSLVQGYLSKPINEGELKKICLKLLDFSSKNQGNKLTVPNGKKKQFFVDIEDLSYIEADGKLTNWFFVNKPPQKAISLMLKHAEELLCDKGIKHLKVNRKYIVFENGIIEKNTKDIIVHSFGLNQNSHKLKPQQYEIGISDSSGLGEWVKKIFS